MPLTNPRVRSPLASTNIAIGPEALAAVTGTTSGTIAIGSEAGKAFTEVTSNVAVGHKAGLKATLKSSSNVFVGPEAGPSAEAETNNQLFIANKAGTETEALIWGNFSEKKLRLNTTTLGFYNAPPALQHTKIEAPAETLASLKTKVEELIAVVHNVGLTA